MSNKDTISHDYMSDNERFADAFNYFIYGGKQVIKPENLIDPHTMTDFDKLHSMLGDVMELIKYQNDGNYLKKVVKEKGENWALDIDSVNMVNAYTTANIPINDAKEGKVIMCRMTEAIREEGRGEGRDALLIKLICKKLSKGKDQTTIIEELELEDEEEQVWAREMIDVASDFGPDYNPDRVFEAYMELQPKT